MAGWPTDRAFEQMGDMALKHRVRLEADGVIVTLSLKEVIETGQREGGITPEVPPRYRAAAITRHHRLQHIAPAIGAVDIAGAQRTPLQIAKLVEHEQRMIAGAAEVTVVGRAFLLAMGRAAGMHRVDPLARQIGERRDIGFSAENLGLEPPHLIGRGGLARHGLPTRDPAHCRASPEPVSVIDILIAGKPPEYRLPELRHQTAPSDCAIRLRHQAVPAIPARPAAGQRLTGHAQCIAKFAKGKQAGIRSDPRTEKLQSQTAVKIDTQITRFRLTRRVRHKIGFQDCPSC